MTLTRVVSTQLCITWFVGSKTWDPSLLLVLALLLLVDDTLQLQLLNIHKQQEIEP